MLSQYILLGHATGRPTHSWTATVMVSTYIILLLHNTLLTLLAKAYCATGKHADHASAPAANAFMGTTPSAGPHCSPPWWLGSAI
jgi:hypothetical protein